MRAVEIHTEPVELFKILKFEGLVASGGEAKQVIDAGEVQVNGAVETRRRRQIRGGDTVEFAGEKLLIRLAASV
jgi:ribosome-associated protein